MARLTNLHAAIIVDLFRLGELADNDGWLPKSAALLVVALHAPRSKHEQALATVVQLAGEMITTRECGRQILILRRPRKSEVDSATGSAYPAAETALTNIMTTIGLMPRNKNGDERQQDEHCGVSNWTRQETKILARLLKLEEETAGPFSKKELVRILDEANLRVQTNYAIALLQKSGLIVNFGYGKWRLTETGQERAKKKNVFKRKPAS
jgi:hypothetical protein